MPNASRGEVWLVDLGMAAKARPAVVLSIPFLDDERALYAIVPHTTATRGGRFEVVIGVPWLEPGAFDVQGQRAMAWLVAYCVLNCAAIMLIWRFWTSLRKNGWRATCCVNWFDEDENFTY
jgi:mRNA interferase MazF